MSTIHHICSSCFVSRRRGFTFTGVIPQGPRAQDPSCPHGLERVIRLSPEELSEDIEIVFDGSNLVIREPVWVLLRQQLISYVETLENVDVFFRPDGVLELTMGDDLALILQPIVDHISKQSGCLIASCIHDADSENPSDARRLLWAMNSALGETALLLGTRRDLFPLEDSSWTVIYSRFIPVAELSDANLGRLVGWAQKVVLFINEALNFFGYSRGAIRFLRNLKLRAPNAVPPEPDAQGGFSRDGSLTGLNGVSRRALLSHTESGEGVELNQLDSRILEFLRALEIDAEQLEACHEPRRFRFHYRDRPITLSLSRDDRDTYICVRCVLADSVSLDAELAAFLSSDALLMGEFVLANAPDGGYELRLQDTILGNDLNVDELAKVLTNIAHQASVLAEEQPERVTRSSNEGADLEGLVSFVLMRASAKQDRAPRLPRVRERLSELFAKLNLYPTLTPGGAFELNYQHVPITLTLSELSPDCYLTVRGHLIPKVNRLDTVELWRSVAPHFGVPSVGGFHVQEDTLTFEDTILGNSLDLNELARTLYEISAVSAQVQPKIRSALGLSIIEASPAPMQSARRRAIDGLTVAYQESGNYKERLRIVRALSMFGDDTAHRCIIEALQDPAPPVSAYAAAALAACLYEEHHELCEPVARMALNTALSDPTRRLACRVLASSTGDGIFIAVRALERISMDAGETPQLRAYALDALGSLGSHQAVNAIVDGVTQTPYAVSHAAIKAMVNLQLPDPAPLFLAAQHAYNRVALGDDPDASTIYRTVSNLGMQESVIELVEGAWRSSSEATLGLAEACATVVPRRLDILKEMLQHTRGEFRRVAYETIGSHEIVKLAETVAECLESERDIRLQGIALKTLRKLSKRTDTIEATILRCAETPHLQSLALEALHELRKNTPGS